VEVVWMMTSPEETKAISDGKGEMEAEHLLEKILESRSIQIKERFV
jgi:hypothetical protein